MKNSDIVRSLKQNRIVKGGEGEPLKSTLISPFNRLMYRGNRNVIEPNRGISYRLLRRVAERAWIINAIIAHYIRNITPFMKPSTDKNVRGFTIRRKDSKKEMGNEDQKRADELAQFFINTGFLSDPEREDDLKMYSAKITRDVLTLDQVATEIQRNRAKKAIAFWAIDAATIVKVYDETPENEKDPIRYIQEVDLSPVAYYTREDLIFDYMNPRTDLDHAGYGYSMVEQAVDLVTGLINSFMYNMGFFTEDRLPRGMLLLQGDADMEEVEMIEDYLVNIMSGGPLSKWHVPIIPAGRGIEGNASEGNRKFEWVSLQGSNKDMEFSQWTEFLWSSVAALFGVDLEELGIRTSKSTTLLGQNVQPRIEASKARGLGSMLGFLEGHLQKILDMVDPRFDFEFLGYEKDDPIQKYDMRERQLRTTKTLDELREEDGDKPFKQPWSQIPLNPYVVQLYQMSMGGGAQGGGEQAMPEGGQGSDENSEGWDQYRKLLMGDEGEESDKGKENEGEEGAQEEGKSVFDKVGASRLPGEQQGAEGQKKESVFEHIGKAINDDTIEIIV
jgi:hypothetical protein